MSFSVKISCQILGLLAAVLLNTVAGQNCSQPIEENLKCFSVAGVEINETQFRLAVKEAGTGGSNKILEDMMKNDSGATCRKIGEKEKLVKVYQCLLDLAGICQASMRDLMISVDKWAAYMDFYCQHEKEIDSNCVQSKIGEIQNCTIEKLIAYQQQHGSPTNEEGARELACEAHTLSSVCQRIGLRSCDNATRTIYTQIRRDYLTPEACLGMGVAWVPSLFMTLLLAMVTARLF